MTDPSQRQNIVMRINFCGPPPYYTVHRTEWGQQRTYPSPKPTTKPLPYHAEADTRLIPSLVQSFVWDKYRPSASMVHLPVAPKVVEESKMSEEGGRSSNAPQTSTEPLTLATWQPAKPQGQAPPKPQDQAPPKPPASQPDAMYTTLSTLGRDMRTMRTEIGGKLDTVIDLLTKFVERDDERMASFENYMRRNEEQMTTLIEMMSAAAGRPAGERGGSHGGSLGDEGAMGRTQ